MENNSDTEIDLWQLLIKGYHFFKKRKGVIVLFFFLGIIYSLSKFFTHPLEYKSYYKKEFIAQSSVTSDEILSDIINGLSLFPEKITSLRNIKGKLAANSNKETRLQVIIESFEKENIDSILTELELHLNSIENLKAKLDYDKQQRLQLLLELNKRIAEHDTTKNNSVRSEFLELTEKKQSVEKELQFAKIVEFTEINPDCVYVSNNRTIILNVLGFGFLGLIIGLIIGFIMNIATQRK